MNMEQFTQIAWRLVSFPYVWPAGSLSCWIFVMLFFFTLFFPVSSFTFWSPQPRYQHWETNKTRLWLASTHFSYGFPANEWRCVARPLTSRLRNTHHWYPGSNESHTKYCFITPCSVQLIFQELGCIIANPNDGEHCSATLSSTCAPHGLCWWWCWFCCFFFNSLWEAVPFSWSHSPGSVFHLTSVVSTLGLHAKFPQYQLSSTAEHILLFYLLYSVIPVLWNT